MPTFRTTNAAPDGLSEFFPLGFQPGRSTKSRFDLENTDGDGAIGTVSLRGRGFSYDDDGWPVAGTVRSLDIRGADGKLFFKITGLDFPLSFFAWFYQNGQVSALYQAMFAAGGTFDGGTANDVLLGGSGEDSLDGGEGADFIVPLEGADVIVGGPGFDQLSYAEGAFFAGTPQNGVRINLANGTAVDSGGDRDRFEGIEAFRLSLADDRFKGSNGDDLVRPLLGDDVVNGRRGTDTVAYDDDASFGGDAGVSVDLGARRAIDGFGSEDRLISIENIIGTAFDDLIVGSAGDNLLRGGNGDDTLEGGAGGDTLSGFEGADTFVFRDRPADGEVDVVADFAPGTDVLQFAGSRFGGLPEGPLADDALVTGTSPGPTGASPVFLYATATGVLGFDADGTGPEAAIAVAILSGAPALVAGDIEIV